VHWVHDAGFGEGVLDQEAIVFAIFGDQNDGLV